MSEEFYIGLNLFSVFLASCTQVVLKKSAISQASVALLEQAEIGRAHV